MGLDKLFRLASNFDPSTSQAQITNMHHPRSYKILLGNSNSKAVFEVQIIKLQRRTYSSAYSMVTFGGGGESARS